MNIKILIWSQRALSVFLIAGLLLFIGAKSKAIVDSLSGARADASPRGKAKSSANFEPPAVKTAVADAKPPSPPATPVPLGNALASVAGTSQVLVAIPKEEPKPLSEKTPASDPLPPTPSSVNSSETPKEQAKELAQVAVKTAGQEPPPQKAPAPIANSKKTSRGTDAKGRAIYQENELDYNLLKSDRVASQLFDLGIKIQTEAFKEVGKKHPGALEACARATSSMPSPMDRVLRQIPVSFTLKTSDEEIKGRIKQQQGESVTVNSAGRVVILVPDRKGGLKELSFRLSDIDTDCLWLFDKDAYSKKVEKTLREQVKDYDAIMLEKSAAEERIRARVMEENGFGWSSKTKKWVPVISSVMAGGF